MHFLITGIATIALAISGFVYTQYDDYGGFDLFGAISFPTSLDTLTNPAATDSTATVSHSSQHSNANDAIEAIEVKMGVDSSAVTTSHDYKLSGVTGSDLACSLTGTETLTNKTLTSAIINTLTMSTTTAWNTTLNGTTTISSSVYPFGIDLGSDATGDVFYRASDGEFTRLGIGSVNQFLQVKSGIPSWETSQANAPTVTFNATSTASTTLAGFTVDGATQITVTAYGSVLGDALGGTPSTTLKWGNENIDVFEYDNDGATANHSFYLRYSGTPVSTTTDISLTNSAGAFIDATIYVDAY